MREYACVRAHTRVQTGFGVSSWFMVLSQCCGKAAWTPAHNQFGTPKNITKERKIQTLAPFLFLVASMIQTQFSL